MGHVTRAAADLIMTAGQMSQPTSPDHAAVIEHSEQFLTHLKAAIMDPKLKK